MYTESAIQFFVEHNNFPPSKNSPSCSPPTSPWSPWDTKPCGPCHSDPRDTARWRRSQRRECRIRRSTCPSRRGCGHWGWFQGTKAPFAHWCSWQFYGPIKKKKKKGKLLVFERERRSCQLYAYRTFWRCCLNEIHLVLEAQLLQQDGRLDAIGRASRVERDISRDAHLGQYYCLKLLVLKCNVRVAGVFAWWLLTHWM